MSVTSLLNMKPSPWSIVASIPPSLQGCTVRDMIMKSCCCRKPTMSVMYTGVFSSWLGQQTGTHHAAAPSVITEERLHNHDTHADWMCIATGCMRYHRDAGSDCVHVACIKLAAANTLQKTVIVM